MTTDSFTIEGYSASMRDDNLGARTIEEYAGIVKRGLAAADPMTYIKSIANAGSRMMPIAAFQRWAAYTGDVTLAAALADYKKKLRHRIPPSKDRQPYSAAEMERMVAGVGGAGRDLAERFALKMLLGTGARSSDICSGITREVLQLATRNSGVAEIRTKGQRLRKINFSWFASDMKALLATPGWAFLYELLAPATDDRECSNKRGYRILDLRFKDLCKRCKVTPPWITHRCRHTVASMVYSKTHDLMATRNWFGWASTQTAERYSHGATFDAVDKDVSDVLPHFDEPKKPKGKKR
jgi:integrase